MSLEIRRATPADAGVVQLVARESWHAAYDDFLGAETVDSTIDSWYDLEGLAASITADDQHLFVADEGDDDPAGTGVVGFVHVGPWPDDPDIAHLARIYVRSDRWGNGIGRRLLAPATAALEADGYRRLRLEAFAENDVGVGFYESTGFERIGEQTETFGGDRHATVVFEREL